MSYENKIKEQSQPYLQAGERVLAAVIARPRGATTAGAGGLGAALAGGRKVGKQKQAATTAGLQLANPMALALTDQRLLVLRISQPLAMGKGGNVQELVSQAPLHDVDSIEVKRLLIGKILTVTVRGTPIKLETGSNGNAQGIAVEFPARRQSPDHPAAPRVGSCLTTRPHRA